MVVNEILLQLITIIFIYYIVILHNSTNYLFFIFITSDSIFSAVYFMKNFLLNNYITKKDLVISNDNLYNINIFNRYIFYFLIELFYFIICYLFWIDSLFFLYFPLLFIISPYFFNYLHSNYLYYFFILIDDEKNKFFKIILCKNLSVTVNTLSKICINIEPKIKYAELLFLFDDYNKTVDNILNFFKNFLLLSLLHYARKNSNILYSNIIKYVYNYKTGELLESIDLKTAKNNFKNVIIKREWNKLLTSELLQSIIYIYSLQNNDLDNFDIYVTKFNFLLLKMFSLWTLSSLFDFIYLIPIISFFLHLFDKKFYYFLDKDLIPKYLIPKYFFKFFAFFLCFFINNYFIISLLSEFGYLLFFNEIIKSIYYYIYDKIYKIIKKYSNNNYYNILLISIFFYIELIKFIIFNFNFIILNYSFIYLIIINYLFFIINIHDLYKILIVSKVIIFGFLSYFCTFHIIFLLCFDYIIINIFNNYNIKFINYSSNNDSDNKIIIDLIDSYKDKNLAKSSILYIKKIFTNNFVKIID